MARDGTGFTSRFALKLQIFTQADCNWVTKKIPGHQITAKKRGKYEKVRGIDNLKKEFISALETAGRATGWP